MQHDNALPASPWSRLLTLLLRPPGESMIHVYAGPSGPVTQSRISKTGMSAVILSQICSSKRLIGWGGKGTLESMVALGLPPRSHVSVTRHFCPFAV